MECVRSGGAGGVYFVMQINARLPKQPSTPGRAHGRVLRRYMPFFSTDNVRGVETVWLYLSDHEETIHPRYTVIVRLPLRIKKKWKKRGRRRLLVNVVEVHPSCELETRCSHLMLQF